MAFLISIGFLIIETIIKIIPDNVAEEKSIILMIDIMLPIIGTISNIIYLNVVSRAAELKYQDFKRNLKLVMAIYVSTFMLVLLLGIDKLILISVGLALSNSIKSHYSYGLLLTARNSRYLSELQILIIILISLFLLLSIFDLYSYFALSLSIALISIYYAFKYYHGLLQ
ncbi:hypothetical protein OAM98_03790 [Schleiferiaceae bacterium]|nr:hypothetical protein [Schleiferiaceae bacterium]